jgi:tRNA threonylcarbamoyladenosine biosynthesis protein TsaB
LQVLAKQAPIAKGLVIPMIDARRMEVYSAIFDANNTKTREVQAEIVTEDSFTAFTEDIYFIGDCQEKCKTVLTKDNFHFLTNVVFPSANEMSVLSYEKYNKKEFEDIAYFEPFYLKDFMLPQKK